MLRYILSIVFCSLLIHASQDPVAINSSTENVGSFKIEGKIIVPPGDNALENTRILIDEGLYIGIPQVDGTFVISGRETLCFFFQIDKISERCSFRRSKWLVYCVSCLASSCIRTSSC